MQAKHINEDRLLALLFAMSHEPKESIFGGPVRTPHWVMTRDLWAVWNDNVCLTPLKVLGAKLERLERRGLIQGYGHWEYRGDLELTEAGLQRLHDLAEEM